MNRDARSRTWWVVTGALCAGGAVIAVVTLPVGALLTIVLAAAITAPAMYWAYTRGEPDDGRGRRCAPPTRLDLVTSAALAPVAVLGSVGAITALGAAALPVIVTVALTSPAILGRYWPRPASARPAVGAETPAPPAPVPPAAPVVVMTEFSDDDLCRDWRVSFAVLQACSDPRMYIEIADHRRAVLDELASRDPAGFERWLHSGARAASDPRPFLTRSRHR